MTCYRPQPATMGYDFLLKKWRQPRILYPVDRDASGAREYLRPLGSFSSVSRKAEAHRYLHLPCGLCFGCRCDNARSWSLRMMHEARYHDACYFITLTYSPESMPVDGDLRYSDLQDFFKRARHLFQLPDKSFKYFACGEYGDKTLRPHYHFAAFDFHIPDLRPFKQVAGGWYFLSDALRDCWKHGHVVVAPLSWQSAAYIARYVTKKMHGSNRRDKGTFNPDTGELDLYAQQRAFQSKGLGLPFYLEHFSEIWDLDGCLYNGKYMVKPPRYYMKQLEKTDPDRALSIKLNRLENHEVSFLDRERDSELLYQMEAKRLHMQTILSRDL